MLQNDPLIIIAGLLLAALLGGLAAVGLVGKRP